MLLLISSPLRFLHSRHLFCHVPKGMLSAIYVSALKGAWLNILIFWLNILPLGLSHVPSTLGPLRAYSASCITS